jgi:membrane associated rhomboid family serine protease
MKSHWDNIAAETARESKRGSSEDQSEISVYSDLAGNIFNEIQSADEESNHIDDAEMSVRITIAEEENEDEDGEIVEDDEIVESDDDDEENEQGLRAMVESADDKDEELEAEENDENDDINDDADEDEEDLEDEEDDDADEDDDDEHERNDAGARLSAAKISADGWKGTHASTHANPELDSADINDPGSGYDDPDDEYDQPDEVDEDKEKDLECDIVVGLKNEESSWKSFDTSDGEATVIPVTRTCLPRGCLWRPYYPTFILFITLLDWLFYLGGIIAMNPRPKITLIGPLSPALPSFPFQTISTWPSCSSKHEHWRLISSQFSHEGIQHLGGYTALGLIYGIILESTHPYHSLITVVVYQAAVILGCLGHSFISPYDALIGCSSGIYGLIGCCLSHLILNKDILEWRVYYGLIAIIVLQVLFEIFAYIIWYSPKTAYAAHFTALAVGIFIGILPGIPEPYSWKKIMGLSGLCAFIVLTICLSLHYSTHLLQKLSTDQFSAYSCCQELLSLASPTLTLDDARISMNCTVPSMRIRR